MADEIEVSGSLQYTDSNDPEVVEMLAFAGIKADVTTAKFIKGKQSIGTSEEAIALGECTSPGWAIFRNIDPTNYIEIKTGTSGTIFAKMLHGEGCGPIRLGSGAQAPYAIANTAACMMHYLIIQT